MKQERAYSIDALRGYAILTMVLSATVSSGILPQWMYHAQTPPPLHIYDASISGLTWVDLVFPFFLFAMGAAFPFSIKKKMEKGIGTGRLLLDAFVRFVKLAFFAIFIQHFYPYVLSSPQDYRSWLLALLAFVLLFGMFTRFDKLPGWTATLIQVCSYAVAITLLLTVEYADGRTFSPKFNNIIILILSNMALFGGVTYIFTAKNLKARLIVMALILFLTLGADIDGSWIQKAMRCSPVPYLLNFDYLRYLLIIIPGSIAGEYVLECIKKGNDPDKEPGGEKLPLRLMAVISLVAIVGNLMAINHHLILFAFLINIAYGVSGYYLLWYSGSVNGRFHTLWRNLFSFAMVLVFLGLFSEVLQGGVKKDPATVSYLLVTSALATYMLISLSIICDYFQVRRPMAFLTWSGSNPMIAYVAGDLLIFPLLGITGAVAFLWTSIPILGFLKGVVLTSLSILVTMFFTRIKWFWRT